MPAEESKILTLAKKIGIDPSTLPCHIAMIMDGNGRWAKKKGLARLIGHREGYRTLRNVLLDCSGLGIRYLTVYAFSAENWKRPKDEVTGLMKLIEQAARDELNEMHQNGVRVRVTGRTNELPAGLKSALEDGVETTKNNKGITFVLAVNYGGRTEIVDAVKQLIATGAASESITEETISQAMYNPDIPDPDLMIRTAGEMRWSNFLMWESAYSELFVTPKPWPEFATTELLEAVQQYQNRIRKFGAVVE